MFFRVTDVRDWRRVVAFGDVTPHEITTLFIIGTPGYKSTVEVHKRIPTVVLGFLHAAAGIRWELLVCFLSGQQP